MAKVAKPIFVPSSSHQLGSGPLKTGSMAIKKTPPELRRPSVVDFTDESQPPLADPTKITEVDNGFKKSKLWKPPRYTDTRLMKYLLPKSLGLKLHLARKMQRLLCFCPIYDSFSLFSWHLH
ncbi:hypothetical protein HKD37_14G040385 [Glycine soja]